MRTLINEVKQKQFIYYGMFYSVMVMFSVFSYMNLEIPGIAKAFVFVFGFTFLFAANVGFTATKKQLLLIGISCVIIGGIFLKNQSIHMLRYVGLGFAAIVGAKNIDIKKIIKLDFYVRAASFVSVIILCAINLVPDVYRVRIGESFLRRSFGFTHPNTCMLMLFCILAAYLYTRFDDIKFWELIPVTFITGVFYYYTRSKTAAITIAFMIFLFFLVKYLKIFKFKAFKYILISFVPLLAGISFYLPLSYKYPTDFIIWVDKMLTGRVWLSRMYIVKFGVSYFGTDISDVPFFMVLDNLYVYLFVGLGIVFSVFVIGMLTVLVKRLYENKMYKELIFIVVFAVYAFTERSGTNIFFNFPLLFLSEIYFANNIIKNPVKSNTVDNIKSLIFRTVNHFTKKDDKKVCFESNPDFSDNAKALYLYLKENTDYKPVWLTKSREAANDLQNEGIEAYYKTSKEGIKHICTSKYLVSTHFNFRKRKVKSQIWVELWHGTPLKKMGVLDKDDKTYTKKDFKKIAKRVDYFTVTSETAADAFQRCFLIPKEKLIITGLARNDLMKNPADEKFNKVLPDVKGKKVIYMPTFRKGYRENAEGEELSDNIFRLKDYNADDFIKVLCENDITIVLKLHPTEEGYYKDFNVNNDNIKMLKTEDLAKNNITIYDIIAQFDVLITDYSSIYFDFLLLDKPIIFTISDEELYSQRRGFLFENYKDYMPGAFVKTQEEMVAALKDAFTQDSFKEKRKQTNMLMNKYTDDNSCSRIYNAVFAERK